MVADEATVGGAAKGRSGVFGGHTAVNGNLDQISARGVLKGRGDAALVGARGGFIETEAGRKRRTGLNPLGDLESFQGADELINRRHIGGIVIALGDHPFAVFFDQIGGAAGALDIDRGDITCGEGFQQRLAGDAGGGGRDGLSAAEFLIGDTAAEGEGDDPEEGHLAFVHGGRGLKGEI